MKLTLRSVLAALVWLAGTTCAHGGDFTRYVNPFIGTGPVAHSLSGNCFPGATMPFGMVQLSPDTQDAPDWDNASGYNYNHTTIYGFSHTHLSGTGACDLLDVLLLPTSGDSLTQPVEHFSHEEEEAHPGLYQVRLMDGDIRARLSATRRVGIHEYRYPQGARRRLWVDLDHSAPKGSWDRRVIQSQLRVVSPTVVEGYRIITGWARLRRVYFRMELSQPIASHVMIDGQAVRPGASVVNGQRVRAYLDFDAHGSEPLMVKVALSTTGLAGARANMLAEAPSWDFDAYVAQADQAWDEQLGRVEAEGEEDVLTTFYTALYHAFIQPNVLSDADGAFTATDYTTQRMPQGEQYYSTLSLWDTFRAIHPLYTLLVPAENAQICQSMLRHYDSYGYLPIWDLWGQDNYCMIGNHAVPVLADAYLKGQLPQEEGRRILKAMAASCATTHPGLDVAAWERYGYMPEDVLSQSVSITLEQAYDDWCVAQVAQALGDTAIYERFMRRAGSWRNLYNPSNGFFQARNAAGQWLEPFDPLQYGANGGRPYTEGNAWQWAWYVPQDIEGLIAAHGGRQPFLRMLDTFFSLEAQSGELNSNASGFIGQYVHGNEPSHHVAYLYALAGRPERTQYYVNRLMREMYNTRHDGYAGNDDCGEMSAWYIFSALGFYPVNPAAGEFVLGTPMLRKATLNLGNGQRFTISSDRQRAEQYRVRRTTLNGQRIQGPTVSFSQISQGGELRFSLYK